MAPRQDGVRTATVTIARSGIGRMTALPLAREGGKVVDTDLDEEQARAVCTVDFGREPATLRRGQPRQNAPTTHYAA
jgi:NAD(P)-dependent dehydrogenase (short-subunit alcohol dehydrogenase family)